MNIFQRMFTRPTGNDAFLEQKRRKLSRIKPILKEGIYYTQTPLHYNFLANELRQKYNIVDTSNVSANAYDPIALSMIEKHKDALVLDCGAGKQATYYPNVVNFEIVAYDTTDVIGVGEELPFKDDSFDAVFSLNVLEHVKNPFACAAELARVMKPGASLYCVVPFLQPLHAYPHHYYNMSHQGLRNLFDATLNIQTQEVIASGLPIWTLSWFLQSWLNGLEGEVRQQFSEMKVSDLTGNPVDYLSKSFVTMLSAEKNFELASTTALIAEKPARCLS